MRPRTAQRVYRWTLYGVLVLSVVALVSVAPWGEIRRGFFDVEVARSMFPRVVVVAARNTLLYTSLSFAIGLVAGLVLALMKLSPVRPYRWLATAYVELLRGLPALVTIMVVGFGVPIALGVRIPGGVLGQGAIGLGAVAAAYMAETIRAGIQAVPRGQMEAARSLGMSYRQAMAHIIIPQAFRIIVPPLTNEFVLLLKDSSLVFVLGTTPSTIELTKFGRTVMSETFNGTPMTVIALVYLAITLPLTRMVAALERRQARARL